MAKMTKVAVADLIGGPLVWATANTPAPSGMSAWQFTVNDEYHKAGYRTCTTLGLIMQNNIALAPEDPFSPSSEWSAVCLNDNGERCRYLAHEVPVAVRRAFVGATHGTHIEIPTEVMEHYQ